MTISPITTALEKAMSYSDYKNLVSNLVIDGKSTGNEQTEALTNYSMLNDRRMKRQDKAAKISDEGLQQIEDYKPNVTWLVLTESWCGDAAQTMPMINKVSELSNVIDFKVALRDENDELMNGFLTNGNKSIPKLIAIDNVTQEVIGDWGPRPSTATKMVDEYKEEYGKLTPEFKQDLQVWYNKDKGQDTLKDLLKLLV